MRTTRIAAVTIASTAMVAGVTSAAVAGHGGGSTAPAEHRAGTQAPAHAHAGTDAEGRTSAAVAVTKGHTLKSTYLSQGSRDGVSLPGGFQTVDDPITVRCTKTCYLEADEGVQQVSTATNNLFALTIRVDGAEQTAPYIGAAPTTFGANAWHTVSGALSPGTHTVQTVIYTEQGTRLYNYSNAVRLYQP